MSFQLFKLPKKQDTKHVDVNMGDLLVNYMADDGVHKIDAQLFRGLDNTTNARLKRFLLESDFKTERQQAGRDISLLGETFIALIQVDGKWLTQFFVPQKYETIKRNITWIIAKSGRTIRNSEAIPVTDLELYYKWYINDKGRVIRDTIYYTKYTGKTIEKMVNDEHYEYPENVKFIPGKIIRNNYNSTPDWVKAGDILREINTFSNELAIEWEKVKTQFQNTATFQKGTQGATIADEIENGKWMHDVFSPNAKFSQSLSAIISGSSTVATIIQTIVFLEDRALKYAFQGREMDSSGTNKHNMQVGLFNQAHGEYNQVKKEQRERDYLDFFKNVVEPITGIQSPSAITIDASIFEQGKIEGMRAAAEQNNLYKSQAANQKAQADNNSSQADRNDVEAALAKKAAAQDNTQNINTQE